MTIRSRLERLSGRLGVPAGPQVECPECGGTGSVMRYGPGLDQSDTPHGVWLLECRLAEAKRRAAVLVGKDPPPPFDEPEPPGEPAPCPFCRGLGEVSQARVAAAEAEVAAHGPSLIERRLQEARDKAAEATTWSALSTGSEPGKA